MEAIKIVYIDDSLDPVISKYLTDIKIDEFEIDSLDIEFSSELGYEGLIKNIDIETANVILIDSRLFENRTPSNGRFTGEEIKTILRKYFPFIEVIVITQNDVNEGYNTIKKYSSNSLSSLEKGYEYYNETLLPLLKNAVRNVYEYRNIVKAMKENLSWDTVLVQKILNSLEGRAVYDELTKTDIDKVIDEFKKLQEKLND